MRIQLHEFQTGPGLKLTTLMRKVKRLDQLRDEIMQDLKRLQAALHRSSARTSSEFVFVPGGLDHPSPADCRNIEQIEAQHQKERIWNRVVHMAKPMRRQIQVSIREHIRSQQLFPRSQVEFTIQNLGNQLQTVSDASARLVEEVCA